METLPSTYASTMLLDGLKREYRQLTPELCGAIREVLLDFAACVDDGPSNNVDRGDDRLGEVATRAFVS